MSPRVKLLALSGLSLCIQQRGACSVTWIRFISCILALAGGICCNVDRHVSPCIDVYVPLGILHWRDSMVADIQHERASILVPVQALATYKYDAS